MRHNLHPSYSAWSSSVPLSHHNFTDYPAQNNLETVLRISLHPACEYLHTQPLLPNGAVFQLFRWKISCGLLWGKCNHACYYCRCLWFHCICFSAVTGLLLIFLWSKLLVAMVTVVPLYLIRFSAVTILLLTCPWRKLLIELICNWGHPGIKLFLLCSFCEKLPSNTIKKKPHILWKSKKSNLSTTAVQKSRSYIHFNWLKFTNLGRGQQSCCTRPHLNTMNSRFCSAVEIKLSFFLKGGHLPRSGSIENISAYFEKQNVNAK